MATAKKLPSGSYRIRVHDKRINGYKSFTAATKKEAERLAAEYLNTPLPSEILTLENAANEYIAAKEKQLSPTTIAEYKRTVRNHFGDLLQCDINTLDLHTIQNWVNALTVSRSPKTVHNVYGLLTAVLSYNDTDIKLSKITLPKKVKHFKRLPPPDVVINTFRGSDIELPVLLAMWCGMRCSEILGIRTSDIHGDILTISRVALTVDGKLVYQERAKTYNSNRQLRLPPQILALIDTDSGSDPLIEYNRRQIYLRFTKAMTAAGYKGVTFHDLRHVNASVMAMLNIPDVYAMERGGWSNTATLKGVYQQTFDKKRTEIDRRIDAYFSDIYDTKYATDKTQTA